MDGRGLGFVLFSRMSLGTRLLKLGWEVDRRTGDCCT